MARIGLIREGKTPPDTRVALSPAQCRQLMQEHPELELVVEPSLNRSFTNEEYTAEGVTLSTDLTDCDILLGIKEVPVDSLIAGKTYLFFSHTKKAQPYNQKLMQALIAKNIRMVDYECLTYPDDQRILGFGFYAGLVGTHNALLTYGRKWGHYSLTPAHVLGTFAALQNEYAELKLPNVKIVITGSGKVAAGALEIMLQLDVEYVEPEDFLAQDYAYPVYTHIKGHTLYQAKDGGEYHRDDLHRNPENFECVFTPFLSKADILVNGVYWDKRMPRLFAKSDLQGDDVRMSVIADVTCDIDGSVPINVGASTIAEPVYGIDRKTLQWAAPYQPNHDVIDVMAVDNLPNELPRDASAHFGLHLEKYILGGLLQAQDDMIDRATICRDGKLMPRFAYLSDYAYGTKES